MENDNTLFMQSLIWSAISEIEKKFENKIKIITKIYELLISENYNISRNICQVSDATTQSFNTLYEKYKLCYLNCLSADFYLQNGRFNRDFVKCSTLGEGGYGVVYNVLNNSDHKNYALKKVRILEKADYDLDKNLDELKIWESLKNEFIVEYKCAWIEEIEYKYETPYREDDSIIGPDYSKSFKLTTNKTLFIQMELCDTTLEEFTADLNTELEMSENTGLGPIGFHVIFKLFLEIIDGINYLHTHKPPLIHRDIKPSNILIKQHSNNSKFVKLGDFGLITRHNSQNMTHTSAVGTPEYIAPEVLNGREYSEKSDMYSVGVVCSNMFLLSPKRTQDILNATKNNTFNSAQYYLKNYQFNWDVPYFESYVKNAFCRVMTLLSKNPEERPTASDIINKSDDYCISLKDVKRSNEINELYYKMLKNQCIGSECLNQYLLKHLCISTQSIDKYVMSSNTENEKHFLIDKFPESINYSKLLSKILDKNLNKFETYSELVSYLNKQEKGLSIILTLMEKRSIKRLIKFFAKHNIGYNLLYGESYNVCAIIMNEANCKVIKFLCNDKFDMKTRENTEFVISLLDKCENLDKSNLYNRLFCKYDEIRVLMEHSKLVYVSYDFIYIVTKSNKFFILEKMTNIYSPRELNIITDSDIIEIIDCYDNASKLNARILTASGSVYSWEINIYSFASTVRDDYYSPKLINEDESICFTKLCVGKFHTLGLSKYGEVYVWQDRYYGRIYCECKPIGLCDYHKGLKFRKISKDDFIPHKVDSLNNTIIRDISSGSNHSMALTMDGKIYCWGQNSCGQLGVGDKLERHIPKLINGEKFRNKIVIKITCTMNDSYILTFDGDIYACGACVGECPSFLKLNNDSNKFVDIFSHESNELFVALSTNQYCFVFQKYYKHVFADNSTVCLMQTPLKFVHNCFYLYSSSSNEKTYKPFTLNNNENCYNKEFYEYTLIQLLKREMSYKANNNANYSTNISEVIEEALDICVSFHGIKLFVENSTEFRCYVMESTKQFIDEFCGFMNDNEFEYLLIHDISCKVVVIILSNSLSKTIDSYYEKSNLRLEIESFDSFDLYNFRHIYDKYV